MQAHDTPFYVQLIDQLKADLKKDIERQEPLKQTSVSQHPLNRPLETLLNFEPIKRTVAQNPYQQFRKPPQPGKTFEKRIEIKTEEDRMALELLNTLGVSVKTIIKQDSQKITLNFSELKKLRVKTMHRMHPDKSTGATPENYQIVRDLFNHLLTLPQIEVAQ